MNEKCRSVLKSEFRRQTAFPRGSGGLHSAADAKAGRTCYLSGKEDNVMGIAGLLLGIGSFVLEIIGFITTAAGASSYNASTAGTGGVVYVIGGIMGIVGIIISAIGIKKSLRKGAPITGLVFSIIATVMFLIIIIIGCAAASSVSSGLRYRF